MAYSVSWNEINGVSIAVERISSDLGHTGKLANGDPIYHGDMLKITYSVREGFSMGAHGEESILVTGSVTAADIYAVTTPNEYKVNWNDVTGCTITVRRTESPYMGASIGNLSKNASIYYGDKLTVTYQATGNYKVTSKGATSITVTNHVGSETIYATTALNMILVNSCDFYPRHDPSGRMRVHLELYNLTGKLYIKGWAYDTANTSYQTRIDVDSQASYRANLPSPECPVGGNHGFEGTFNTLGGRHMIHTWSAVGGNPIKIWDDWINEQNNTVFGIEFIP